MMAPDLLGAAPAVRLADHLEPLVFTPYPHAPGGSLTVDPVVAVIVPVFDAEDFVAATLQSVQDQTFSRWECIVVDDGARDRSAERASEAMIGDSRMRLVQQKNSGVSAARNTGLAQVSPSVRYVAYLDADDTWCPTALEDLLAPLERDGTAVGSFGYAELMDAAGRPVRPGFHVARQRDRRRINGRRLESVEPAEPLTFDEAVVVGPLWPPAVGLHRRSVIEAVGPFDTSLAQVEDWDYFQRMLRHGNYLAVTTQVAWYRQHGAQATLQRLELSYAYEVVRRKVWASSENTAAQRHAATWAWRQLQFRQTGRCLQRLVGALRGRRWQEAFRLAIASGVLVAQNLGTGPPRVSRRQLRWSGQAFAPAGVERDIQVAPIQEDMEERQPSGHP